MGNFVKWAIGLLFGFFIYLGLGLYCSLGFEVKYPGAKGFMFPGIANCFNFFAIQSNLDFSVVIWGFEILFCVLFIVFVAGLFFYLSIFSKFTVNEQTLFFSVNLIVMAIVILIANFLGTQLL